MSNKIKTFEAFLNENFVSLEDSRNLFIINTVIDNMNEQRLAGEEVNEGWKDIVLGGLLALITTGGIAQTTAGWDREITKTEVPGDKKSIIKKVDISKEFKLGDNFTKKQADEVVEKLLKQGWSLNSADLDTLWGEVVKHAPDTIVHSTTLKFMDEEYFKSGKFNISADIIASIDSACNEIMLVNGTVISVNITSSTDKQGLSEATKGRLKDAGFSQDNAGLSKARAASVKNFLTEKKSINSSIIQQENLAEKGTGEIDQSARYVLVDFIYAIPTLEILKKQTIPQEVKYLVNLTKTIKTKLPKGKGFKFHIPLGKAKVHPNRGEIKCPVFKN